MRFWISRDCQSNPRRNMKKAAQGFAPPLFLSNGLSAWGRVFHLLTVVCLRAFCARTRWHRQSLAWGPRPGLGGHRPLWGHMFWRNAACQRLQNHRGLRVWCGVCAAHPRLCQHRVCGHRLRAARRVCALLRHGVHRACGRHLRAARRACGQHRRGVHRVCGHHRRGARRVYARHRHGARKVCGHHQHAPVGRCCVCSGQLCPQTRHL